MDKHSIVTELNLTIMLIGLLTMALYSMVQWNTAVGVVLIVAYKDVATEVLKNHFLMQKNGKITEGETK